MFSRQFLENTYEILVKRYKLCIVLQKHTPNFNTLVTIPSILEKHREELQSSLSQKQKEHIQSLRNLATKSLPSASDTSSNV
jgi:hypothetical protein